MSADAKEGFGAMLARLDLLLHREILRLRAAYELSLDEFRGLYVSDEQVDSLVDGALRERGVDADTAALTARAAELRRAAPGGPRWRSLATEFGLSPFEEDALLLALAPELDVKYETLYAYLNNDVSRRFPTRDLALRLFTDGADERWRLRAALLPDAPLLAGGLLRELDAAERPGALSARLAPAPLVARFALGLPLGTDGLGPGVTLEAPGEPRTLSAKRIDELRRAARLWASAGEPVVLVLEGPRGSRRAEAADLVCRELDLPLLRVEPAVVRTGPEGLADLLRTLSLRQRLEPAGVYVAPPDGVIEPGSTGATELRALVAAVGHGGPVMLTGPTDTPWREVLPAQRCLVMPFPAPDRDERRRLWEVHLVADDAPALDVPTLATLDALADRFRLSPGEIRSAVTRAMDAERVAGGVGGPGPEALFRAAREESGHQLSRLAARVDTPHGWGDLVLPASCLRRVREVAAAVQHRHTVYATWGFDRRLGPGQGLRALFAGPSGTGKTMAAGVIARELGLDLYRVDLAGVVSKYIGETEKNLERIFNAAHAGSAVLFFDEADALFGKRSEVKDAHDRYANIEVAYLLQRIEEHSGIVILATNLQKNIDAAFARRMHYVVEFPLPDDAHRERLWRGMFPERIPLERGADFRFLARQFPLSGGDIRNVALEAAFLAAQDGRVVTMRHLVIAVARQLLKQGKIPSPNDFRQYHGLLSGSD